jgi:hypothetical protein
MPATLSHCIDEAIVMLLAARIDLRKAGCRAAARRLTNAIDLADGARRQARRRFKRSKSR